MLKRGKNVAVYRRKQYLINPRFQVRYSLFVCSFVFLLSLLQPLIIYEFYERILEKTQSVLVKEVLLSSKAALIEFLISFELVFIALVFIICIFQGHKIAGPLHKMGEYLRKFKDGIPQDKISFRKGDQFHELADEYNSAVENLLRRDKIRHEKVDELREYVSSCMEGKDKIEKSSCDEILKKVLEIQNSH